MMQSRDQPALDADGFLVLVRTGFATGDMQWFATTDAHPDFETLEAHSGVCDGYAGDETWDHGGIHQAHRTSLTSRNV
jgi:hypothetical protein